MAEYFQQALDRFTALPRAAQVGAVVGAGVFTMVSQYVVWRIKEKSYPYNAYTTNEDAIAGLDLTGKVAVVTGANNGIGLEAALVMAKQGCRVFMACRNTEKGDKAKAQILERLGLNSDNNQLTVMKLDLSSLGSVTEFAKEFNKLNLKIDYLVNNAGIMAVPDYRTSTDGYELQFATNHLGHFLLTNLLMPSLLRKTEQASDRLPRVINLASSAHRYLSDYSFATKLFDSCIKARTFMSDDHKGKYEAWLNYGVSKTSNILFARELQRRYSGNLISVSLHPGGIATGLGQYMTGKDSLHFLALLLTNPSFGYKNMKSINQGAATTLRCVSLNDDEIKRGYYYANCKPGIDHGFLMSSAKEDLNNNNELAKKLWELSEILVQEKGFSLSL